MKYRGIRVEHLSIDSVFWPDGQVDYIRSRSSRRSNDVDIEPEWASEAVLDPKGTFADQTKADGSESRSLAVIGWSKAAGFCLVVWIIPVDLQAGEWIGVNAAKAGRRWIKQYRGGSR